MILAILSILADISLGLMAYTIARKVAKVQEGQLETQKIQGQILRELTHRVTALENGHNRPLGFKVDPYELP